MVNFATIVAESLSLSLILLSFAGAAVLLILLAVSIKCNAQNDERLRAIPIRTSDRRRARRPSIDCQDSSSDPGMPLPQPLRHRQSEEDSLGD